MRYFKVLAAALVLAGLCGGSARAAGWPPPAPAVAQDPVDYFGGEDYFEAHGGNARDNRAAVKSADIILLCVKPQTLGEVVQEIEHDLGAGQLIISIAASVPTSYIEQRIPAKSPVVRAMPNTPSRDA